MCKFEIYFTNGSSIVIDAASYNINSETILFYKKNGRGFAEFYINNIAGWMIIEY